MTVTGPSNPETQHTAFRGRGRILVRLLAVLVFVALAPLATSIWRVIDDSREALTTSTQQFQLLLASSIAEKLDLKLESVLADLNRASRAIEAQNRETDAASPQRIRDTLASFADVRIRHLYYSTPRRPDEHPVGVGPLPSSLASPLQHFVSDIYASYRESRDPDALRAISRPMFVDEGQEHAVLLVSWPVSTVDDDVQLLTAVVDLSSLWELVTAEQRDGSVVYALDDTGKVFASTHPAWIGPGEDMTESTPVKRFLAGHGLTSETMPYTDRHDGAEYLGSYETTSRGWGVFVRSRLHDVYGPIRLMVRNTMTWALLALGAAVLTAVAFAASLSSPIQKLAIASRAFARGEFATRVNVRTRNEIGELAHTFNTMATEIERHIDNLQNAATENSALFEGTILALAKAIDAKDPYTRGHSVRVNKYSLIIARQLGMSGQPIREIHVASLLHDVGKIGIDDAVLKKPGKLTAEEYEHVKTHAAVGANIMASIPKMKEVLPGLRWHHERLDGSGYPDGLVGQQIPMMARIIAVADTFDAVTSDRSYQRTRTFPEGRHLLHELKGELDPAVVDAFDRAYEAGKIQPDEPTARHLRQHQNECASSVPAYRSVNPEQPAPFGDDAARG